MMALLALLSRSSASFFLSRFALLNPPSPGLRLLLAKYLGSLRAAVRGPPTSHLVLRWVSLESSSLSRRPESGMLER